MLFTFFLILTIILDTLGDIILKKWGIGQGSLWIILGVVIVSLSAVFWGMSLRLELLAKSAVYYNVANLILAVLAGYILFKEEISLMNFAGVILGIIAIILVAK